MNFWDDSVPSKRSFNSIWGVKCRLKKVKLINCPQNSADLKTAWRSQAIVLLKSTLSIKTGKWIDKKEKPNEIFNTKNMTNPTIVSLVKMEYG